MRERAEAASERLREPECVGTANERRLFCHFVDGR